MVKHGHKKEKIKKSSLLYNVNRKKSKRKKVWVKALLQEIENKGAFHQTLQNICVSDREAHFRYYSNLNSEYFTDLYCNLRK